MQRMLLLDLPDHRDRPGSHRHVQGHRRVSDHSGSPGFESLRTLKRDRLAVESRYLEVYLKAT